MSGKQYLKNQLPVLLLNLLGVLALALFLIATGTSRQAISFIALVWIVVVVCYTLTISENIALALSINKTPARDVEPRIQDIAQKLNITDILNKYPYQVSGGQKQRCACARAIINNPKLLLADEPTGALDSHSAQMLLSTIQSINEQLSATILMVTHDAFTASYASRILFLQDGAIFTELRKGNDSRSAFFEKILNVLTMIGGGQSHVC